MVGSQPINGSDKSSSLVLFTNLERPTMSDNMTINRLRFGFHRSDNRFQNSVPVLALLVTKKKHFIFAPLVSDNRVSCDIILLNVRFLKHIWLAENLTELVE